MIHTSAPGKLFIAGEWAILEPGNPGIVAAVNKRVHCTIEESDNIEIELKDFGIKVNAILENGKLDFVSALDNEQRNKLIFVKAAIETTSQYLGEYKNFRIITWGEETQIEIEGKKKKVGFGSSAAAVVAIVAALLSFNNKDTKSIKRKDTIYKLATISHYIAQGKVGSAFDIAASTYGGIFVYKRFDPEWLLDRIKEGNLQEVVKEKWPGFFVKELGMISDFNLKVAWTKEEAPTSVMVREMNSFKETNHKFYKGIYREIADTVSELIDAWNDNDQDRILNLIQKNEILLRDLTKKSKVNIETHDLKKLADTADKYKGAGKLSGAGGGDCGIAVAFDKVAAEKIADAWKKEGFYVIDLEIDGEGVKNE